MYKITNVYAGSGYNKEVRLIRREYDNGRVSWEFRGRRGEVGNPTEDEAQMIIKSWKLEEIENS